MNQRSNKKIVQIIIITLFAMFGVTYASIPLYKKFCQVTGFGGTPRIFKAPSEKIGEKRMRIKFNADINKDLKWIFRPEQQYVDVKTGENSLIFYYAENLTNKSIKGMAIYNVIPQAAAKYFNKIECFCFNEQTLSPHEKVNMPVLFFIDPEIAKDEVLKDLKEITLSYSFFKVDD
jgi:cytochrome c oxidase assembly protein subunit 11